MHAHDMRAGEDGGGDCRERAEESSAGGPRFVAAAERVADETLARGAGQQRIAELCELAEARQQRIIFVEPLSEAEAGIEDEAVTFNASVCSAAGDDG